MKFALVIARRYLSSRKEKSFVQKISNICIILVAVSIAVPILVLSVFGGFHQNTGNKILTIEADIKILPPAVDFTNYEEIIQIIKNEESISKELEDIIPYFSAYGFIKKSVGRFPTRILAVPEEFYNTNKMYNKEMVNSSSVAKKLPKMKKGNIVLARGLMGKIGAASGNDISIYIPFSLNPVSINLQETMLEIAGGFSLGFNNFDTLLTIMRFEDVSKSFNIQNYATGLMIYLKNHDKYKDILTQIKQLPALQNFKYKVTQEEGLFVDFKREKSLMRVALMILVLASFMTIYITLNVVVMDKQKEIGIMKAFGVNSSTISKIFITEGFLIGIIGAFIGVSVGMFMAVNLSDIIKVFEYIASSFTTVFFDKHLPFRQWFNLVGDGKVLVMPGNSLYINDMPSNPIFMDILIQTIGAITASVLAAYFPSARASKQKPIETLVKK